MAKTLILAAVLLAQSASPPAFDVASVKVNGSGSLRTDARISPSGRVDLTNQTLKALIRIAHSLPDSQIAGGPGQSKSDARSCFPGVGRHLRPPQQGAGPSPAAGCAYEVAGGTIVAHGFPLVRLVESLSIMLRRLVVDRTGLTGNFDFEMTWTPEQRIPGDVTPFDPNAPMLTALQEQLGLRLEATRAPVDFLVIDRAERPTEN